MRLFRKSGNLSKLQDEEEPLGLLQNAENNGSDIELAQTGVGSTRRSGMPAASDEESSVDENMTHRNKTSTSQKHHRYQRIGQLPAGFMSISALAHEGPERAASPGGNDAENHAVEPLAHESTWTPETTEFKSDLKRKLYLLLEQPSSSSSAFWVNVIVSVLIVLSAVMTTIETIPAFRSSESNRVWFNLETAMVGLFTLEYLLRVFAHSDSFRMLSHFFLSPLSVIDFIAIVPFYIELLAKRDTTYEFRFTILRLFRLLRLFRSYKYSNAIVMTIEVMVVALRRSRDALSALFFFLVTCVVLLATLLYFAERGVWDESLQTFVDPDGNPSSFDSIPAAFWFVLVTITTTGYGDMVPATFIGKLVTFPAMMFGVLLIALPSIIIGRNFTIVWEAMRRRQYYNELLTDGADEYRTANAQDNSRHDVTDGQTQGHDPVTPNLSQTTTNPLSPPPIGHQTHGYDILGNENDQILNQLQTLMVMTRQNQEAIQHILAVLEKQGRPVTTETEADLAQEPTSPVYHRRNTGGNAAVHRRPSGPEEEAEYNRSTSSTKGKSGARRNTSDKTHNPDP